MKIWCVDYAGLSYHISSHLFFNKMEAEDFYESRNHCGNYVRMYQVEDIWGWCARNFEDVIAEVMASRDSGDDFVYVHGLVEELKEAAAHCGLEQFSVDACWSDEADNRVTDTFVLSVAWVSEGKLFHRIYRFEALGTWYNYPTIVERRSKWQEN